MSLTVFARGTWIDLPDQIDGVPVYAGDDLGPTALNTTPVARIVAEAGLFFTTPHTREFVLHFRLDAPDAQQDAYSADPFEAPAPRTGSRYLRFGGLDHRQRPTAPDKATITRTLRALARLAS